MLELPVDTVFPAYVGCGGIRTGVVEANYEQRVIELTNQERGGQQPAAFGPQRGSVRSLTLSRGGHVTG